MNDWRQTGVIALAILLAAFLIGGRYTISHSERGFVFVVDRFTGSVRFCANSSCEDWPEKPPEKPATPAATNVMPWERDDLVAAPAAPPAKP